MNRSELRQLLSNPIKHNSMYDNDDPTRTKSKVFSHVIGVEYDYSGQEINSSQLPAEPPVQRTDLE